MTLWRGTFGYRYDLERPADLEINGGDYQPMLRQLETLPAFNPYLDPLSVIAIKDQKSIGACAGFSLSSIAQLMYWRATGRQIVLSAMGAYILSQERDGLRGRDNGATISSGRYVATEVGFCLDSEWPFVNRYDPREPSPKPSYSWLMKTTKPMRTVDEVRDWLRAGGAIHVGITWGDEMDRERVDSFSGRSGGGHALALFGLSEDEQWARCLNSWGSYWNGDGVHWWSFKAIGQMLAHKWTVMVGYMPEMAYPNPDPVG